MKNRIRELRRSRDLTMKQLGTMLGLAESTVSQYETGKRNPDNETLLKLGEIFDVTVGYLLGAEETPTPITEGELFKNCDLNLSEPERALIAAYRAASPDDRAIIDNIVRRYTHAAEATRLA